MEKNSENLAFFWKFFDPEDAFLSIRLLLQKREVMEVHIHYNT